MSDNTRSFALIFLFVLLVVFFGGEPDLHDALVSHLTVKPAVYL